MKIRGTIAALLIFGGTQSLKGPLHLSHVLQNSSGTTTLLKELLYFCAAAKSLPQTLIGETRLFRQSLVGVVSPCIAVWTLRQRHRRIASAGFHECPGFHAGWATQELDCLA